MNIQRTKLKPVVIGMLVLMMTSVGFANRVTGAEASETKCLSIFASDRQFLVTEECDSLVGFCAAGTFNGNHGFKGTSSFSATSFDPIANDIDPVTNQPVGRQVVPGVSTYTTDDGSITISDVSMFDAVRGTFSGIGRIVQGTGRFAGATGDIFTAGRALADGSFINEVRGEICIPK